MMQQEKRIRLQQIRKKSYRELGLAWWYLAKYDEGEYGMSQAVICPVCNGKGKLQIQSNPSSTPCHGCGGRGWVEVGQNWPWYPYYPNGGTGDYYPRPNPIWYASGKVS